MKQAMLKYWVVCIIAMALLMACDDGATGNKPGDTDGDSDIQVEGDDIDTAEILENHDQVHIDGDDADDIDNTDPVDDPVCLPEIDAPKKLFFEAVFPGETTEQELVLENTGCGVWNIIEIDVFLDQGMGEFMILDNPVADGNSAIGILPGDSLRLNIRFQPLDFNYKSAHLRVNGNVYIIVDLLNKIDAGQLCSVVKDNAQYTGYADNLLDMGSVPAGETKQTTLRFWNCSDPELSSSRLILERPASIRDSNPAISLEQQSLALPVAMKPKGATMPEEECDGTNCFDIIVTYQPLQSHYFNDRGQRDVEYGDFAYYNGYDESLSPARESFNLKVEGSSFSEAVEINPMAYTCGIVMYNDVDYVGYVVRNYTGNDILLHTVTADLSGPMAQYMNLITLKGESFSTIPSGQEYPIYIKYQPVAGSDTNDRVDKFAPVIEFCHVSDTECREENPHIRNISSQVLGPETICTATAEDIEARGWNLSCNDAFGLYGNPEEDDMYRDSEWSWVDKPENSEPEMTRGYNRERDYMTFDFDGAGVYMIGYRRTHAGTGHSEYTTFGPVRIHCP